MLLDHTIQRILTGKPDWSAIERYTSENCVECVPTNVRGWKAFEKQYAAMVEFSFKVPFEDPTFRGMTRNCAWDIATNKILGGHGSLQSPMRFFRELDSHHKSKLMDLGLLWAPIRKACQFINRMQDCNLSVLNSWGDDHDEVPDLVDEDLPYSVAGSFDCTGLNIKSLDGAPVFIGETFRCNSQDVADLAFAKFDRGEMWFKEMRIFSN